MVSHALAMPTHPWYGLALMCDFMSKSLEYL